MQIEIVDKPEALIGSWTRILIKIDMISTRDPRLFSCLSSTHNLVNLKQSNGNGCSGCGNSSNKFRIEIPLIPCISI